MTGILRLADSIKAELEQLLPRQRKTQRGKLSLLVATMLDARSANLMDLAAALPLEADRTDMRYQWIARFLANPLVDTDEVMAPFARQVLERQAGGGEPLALILDQSKISDRHQVLMLAVRFGERALPLAWRVEATEGAIGFEIQKALLDAVAPWVPPSASVTLLGDRFYGTADLIGWCQEREWDYRLRLKGNLVVVDGDTRTTTKARAAERVFYLEDVELTGKRARTNIGIIHDPGHAEPWIIAMSVKPRYLKTLEYGGRWGIEAMFSDFKSRGFGIEDTHIHYPERLGRLLLVMALALHWAVSTGLWDARHHRRIQAVVATPSVCFPLWMALRNSSRASAGVFQPRVLRGLVLRASATANSAPASDSSSKPIPAPRQLSLPDPHSVDGPLFDSAA